MRIDHYKKIFIHIPRTAGGSIATIFGMDRHRHYPIHNFTEVASEGWTRFAVVRNPWARLYSIFNWVRDSGYHNNQAILGSRGHNTPFGDWLKENLHKRQPEFPRYVPHFDSAKTWEGMRWRTHHHLGSSFWFSPQLNWICDDNDNLLVNECVRFTELTRNYSVVRSRLNLPAVQLPHENQSRNRSPYTSAYTCELIELVEDTYRREIEMFGFEFDDERRHS